MGVMVLGMTPVVCTIKYRYIYHRNQMKHFDLTHLFRK